MFFKKLPTAVLAAVLVCHLGIGPYDSEQRLSAFKKKPKIHREDICIL